MDEMKKGTIKRIKVNPTTGKAAILFEDGKAYYINSLSYVRSLMNSFKYGDLIGKTIGYELSGEKIDDEGVIKRFFVKGAIIG